MTRGENECRIYEVVYADGYSDNSTTFIYDTSEYTLSRIVSVGDDDRCSMSAHLKGEWRPNVHHPQNIGIKYFAMRFTRGDIELKLEGNRLLVRIQLYK